MHLSDARQQLPVRLLTGMVGLGMLVHGDLKMGVLMHSRHVPLVWSSDNIQDSVRVSAVDTGEFAYGWKDFSRYTIPGRCLAAARNVRDDLRMSLAMQLAATTIRSYAPERDSLPDSVAIIAKKCGARFTVQGTAYQNLEDLFQLALLEGNDSLANATLHQSLSFLAADTEDMEVRLQEAVATYLSASPARMRAAEALVAQLDTIGSLDIRLGAHNVFLAFARASSNEALGQREAERLIAMVKAHPHPNDYEAGMLFSAYKALMWIAYVDNMDNGQTAGLKIAQRFQQDEEVLGIDYQGMLRTHLTPEQVRGRLMPSFYDNEWLSMSKLPPLVASYWFPAKPTVWPSTQGQAALILNGSLLLDNCLRDDYYFFSGIYCAELYNFFPRWKEQYGDRLAVTLVSMTKGHAIRSMALSPAAEADSIAWFFRNYRKLPVTVAVVEDSIAAFPTPDNRRWMLDTAFYGIGNFVEPGGRGGLNGTGQYPPVIYYAPNGMLRYAGVFDATLLQALIGHDLAVSTAKK